ncbi:flagellar biosynthesis protein FlhF [Teredinibacter sp. KSP-S5-2]|uniref:flagellar biosynthesis protein FlhF n=1 Tax=Teredinibacter sp. KSP-S5-2 TaxID=3034506 RepID=UPI0029346F42|nr:flagellar biosynthesis protein FlhF [Teredinibacter sp. KSP-S5-2]WNO07895.1 flagellar biosynthesis protein FlhF [Teredinibacter sp. KSP-S5-2]
MPFSNDTQMDQQQVKKFTAATMSRALELVRAEMGPEAVILSSRRVDKGVEIITSLEPDLPTRGIDVRREFSHKFDAEVDRAMASDSAWKTQAGLSQAASSYSGHAQTNAVPSQGRRGEQIAREIELAREKMLEAKRRAKEADAPLGQQSRYAEPHHDIASMQETRRSQPVSYHDIPELESQHQTDERKMAELRSEIADMRMLLEQQLWQMGERKGSGLGVAQQVKLPAQFPVIDQHLSRLGLAEDVIEDLVVNAGSHKRVSDSWRSCMTLLSKKIPVVKDDMVSRGGIFAFVGQTGVGKTTSIAKLAAKYVLEHGPGKVALVTTDTYRVGACDQLRSLGRILNVPVRAVDAENSLLTVLAGLRQFPLILIDTAGFRHGDPLLKEQLAMLDTCSSIKKILVMSCNSQWQTMKASAHAYSSSGRPVDACVLTKLDETASLGEAISVILQQGLPLAYTTDGQEIPKDIAKASGHSLVARSVALLKNNSADTANVAAF